MIDLGWFGWITWDVQFLSGLATIILVNIVLSGDNAVLIALAVRGLEPGKRVRGIILGSLLAVILRIVLTTTAVTLLHFAFIKLAGGAFIAWIAVKLFRENSGAEGFNPSPFTLWGAVKLILIADLLASVENVLAVAGAAEENRFLIISGLGISIPLVVGSSTMLTFLMNRYPVIVTAGAGVIGKVSGEMMITDPWVVHHLNPTRGVEVAVQILFIVGVIVVGKFLVQGKKGRHVDKENGGHPTLLSRKQGTFVLRGDAQREKR